MNEHDIYETEVARTYLHATGEPLVGNNTTNQIITDSLAKKLSPKQTVSRIVGLLAKDPALKAAYLDDAKQLGLTPQ